MKALEILKKNKNVAKWVEPNYLRKAIEELEAIEILANRGCNGCKYEKVVECEECIYCKTNCFDRWESI